MVRRRPRDRVFRAPQRKHRRRPGRPSGRPAERKPGLSERRPRPGRLAGRALYRAGGRRAAFRYPQDAGGRIQHGTQAREDRGGAVVLSLRPHRPACHAGYGKWRGENEKLVRNIPCHCAFGGRPFGLRPGKRPSRTRKPAFPPALRRGDVGYHRGVAIAPLHHFLGPLQRRLGPVRHRPSHKNDAGAGSFTPHRRGERMV